jgi:hypothetical protein
LSVKDDFKDKEVDPKEEKIENKEVKFNDSEWKEVEEVKEASSLTFAQHMPHYLDCAAMTEEEKKVCTREKRYKHFGKMMKIPATIKMKGVATYLVFVYFEVNKKGIVSNVRILNDQQHKIPKELEREAYHAVSTLSDLVPAKKTMEYK